MIVLEAFDVDAYLRFADEDGLLSYEVLVLAKLISALEKAQLFSCFFLNAHFAKYLFSFWGVAMNLFFITQKININ